MKAKEGVPNGAGKPEVKASETDPGLTSPQTKPTEHMIDLQAQYKDPRNPEKTLTGEELLQQMSRGGILDQVQSKLHKRIQDLTVRADAGEEAQALATELQDKLHSIEQKELIRDEIDNLNLKSQSKPTDELVWPDDEDKKTVEIDSEVVLERLGKIEANLIKKHEEATESSLRKILAQDKEKQAADTDRQKRIEEFVERTRAADLATYQAKFPTAPKEKLISVIDTKTTASELANLARRAESEGDSETSEQAYIEARARETEALMQLSEIREEDAKLQAKLQHEQEIELVTRGAGTRDTQGTRKREMNPKKAEENRQTRLEKARELEKLGQRYRNVT